MVFFDDGYAQYVEHKYIYVVCESSTRVYEDIPKDSQDFIKKYLESYPERPMVKLSKGQILKTEWNGKWWLARVVDVDASLVQMHFDADNRTEWIYRGSARLRPLYIELMKANARQQGHHTTGTANRLRLPQSNVILVFKCLTRFIIFWFINNNRTIFLENKCPLCRVHFIGSRIR